MQQNYVFDKIKQIWEECELEDDSQKALNQREHEIHNLLKITSECLNPTIYYDKKDNSVYIEWPHYGIFCQMEPSYFSVSVLSNAQKFHKEFQPNEFFQIFPKIIPFYSDTKLFKLFPQHGGPGYLFLVTFSTCKWIKTDNREGCESSVNDEFMKRLTIPQNYDCYMMPESVRAKFILDHIHWDDTTVLPNTIKLETNNGSIALSIALSIDSDINKIVKVLE